MLKRILDAMGALLEDAPVFSRLIDEMKTWGESQQQARHQLVTVLSNVVASFERAHAIVLIELSRLAAARDPAEYKAIIANELERDKFYHLFQANKICQHVHQLHADLHSGFGDIRDAIVLGAAKKLAHSLGEFEQGEYTLAQQYQEYLGKTLFSAFTVNTMADMQQAVSQIVDEQLRLSEELAELSRFKQRILQLSLYGKE